MKKNSDSIIHIDYELSSLCNARCPVCPRLSNGQYTNFVQSYHTIEDTKRIFDSELVNNLEDLTICGNFGDGMANPDILKILTWFKKINSNLNITVSTNGSAGTPKLYSGLAKIGVNVIFAIDGYGNKNELYRVNSKWKRLEKNIKSFSENCNRYQCKVQYIAWSETIDQVLPIIDFLTTLNCEELWIRKPYTHYGGDTKVYDVKGKPSHILTEVNYEPFLELLDTRWRYDSFDILKNKLINMNIPTPKSTKLKFNPPQISIDRTPRDYNITEFKFTDKEISEISNKQQTCQSINAHNPSDINIENYFLYITHDNYLMPCCMIPPFISSSMKYYTGREENRQKEILNKIYEIGLDNFSLNKRTIREIFDSGVIHDFIYKNIKNNKSFQYCKMMCGKCV